MQAPPRPAKSGYEYVNSPEVPPKMIPSSNAPPLPPRFTPDKRLSNPQLFESPGEGPNVRRPQRIPYAVVDISLDDSEFDFDAESDMVVVVQRDSGISTTSHEVVQNAYSVSTNSLPMISAYKQISLRGHQKTSSNPEEFVHQKLRDDNDSIEEATPPPPALPPKNFVTHNFEDNESYTNSDSTSDSMPLPPIPPIKQQAQYNTINGNCQIVPSCCVEYIPENLQPCCVPNREEDGGECIEECFCDNPPPQHPPANHQPCC